MASTYSTNLALELIGTGEQSGTWGTTTNTNLGTLLEQAISGYVTQAITDGSSANTTITIPNGATGVARNMFIEMTGALSFSTTSLIVPANKKMYFIFNNTSGGFAVTVKVSGQTGILVPNGKKVVLTCNGTDIVEAHTAIVGNATMGGTLGVTGATTLSSTLGVTGITTVAAGSAALPAIVSTTGTADTGVWFPAADTVAASTAGVEALRIDSSGNVGIGTSSPQSKLTVRGVNLAASSPATYPGTIQINETAIASLQETGGLEFRGAVFGAGYGAKITSTDTGDLLFGGRFNNASWTERMRLDSSGNLGLGVTPSAWASGSKAIEIGTKGSAIWNLNQSNTSFTCNAYYDTAYKYGGTGLASSYQQAAGIHYWYTAPSGTAGNAITFTQAMTLNASGNLGIGTAVLTSQFNVMGSAGAAAPVLGGGNIYVADTSVGVDRGGGILFGTNSSGTGTSNVFAGIKGLMSDSANNTLGDLAFYTRTSPNSTALLTEKMRIASTGAVTIGGTLAAGATTVTGTLSTTNGLSTAKTVGVGSGLTAIVLVSNTGVDDVLSINSGSALTSANAAGCALKIGNSNSTLRSINAAGTINASGADYAEYMTKAGDFTIAKGDVVGIDAQGNLTNLFSDAASFAVKSTDPSYVGGDSWGNEDAIGKIPTKPVQIVVTDDAEAETDEAFAVRMSQYETDKTAFEVTLEAARQKVDRIAFAGQVPVNVTGATAGQYIIPINDNGAIKGEAVSNPTFEQYKISVGKVIAIDADGRAKIIVKVA